MASPSTCQMRVRITFAIIGIIVGISILVVFGTHYKNWNTALWGLISGLAAAVTLYIHVGFLKSFWVEHAVRLKMYMLTGCFIQLAGVCGLVTYLVLAITHDQGLVIYGPGYYLTCVWCFMTWKWGFQLFYFSRSYHRCLTGTESGLLPEEKTVYTNYGVVPDSVVQ